jgi:hypothetical protein
MSTYQQPTHKSTSKPSTHKSTSKPSSSKLTAPKKGNPNHDKNTYTLSNFDCYVRTIPNSSNYALCLNMSDNYVSPQIKNHFKDKNRDDTSHITLVIGTDKSELEDLCKEFQKAYAKQQNTPWMFTLHVDLTDTNQKSQRMNINNKSDLYNFIKSFQHKIGYTHPFEPHVTVHKQ